MVSFRVDRPLREEPDWPESDGRPIIFLLDASSHLERRLLASWIERHRRPGVSVRAVRIPSSRRPRPGRRLDPKLEAWMTRGDNPAIVPLRVAWLPGSREDRRSVRLADFLRLGDPRDPDVLRQYLFLARDPDRCRILAAEPTSASDIHAQWETGAEIMSLTEFGARRAWLALERAERRLRANRYKVPRFVHEEILGTTEFRHGIVRLADQLDKLQQNVFRRASRYLREIAATHDPLTIDLVANAIHWLYRRGYGSIHYSAGGFRDVYALGEQSPLVFLPSHKSHLDHLALQYLLWENDAPPNHAAGGINMNFFPVGPIIRRTGVFFIRRTFKDNPVYKFVLRSYVDYLVEKRFPLEWYLEGGRSRSGKLLPPRYGMLAYVVDSFRRGKAEDVHLIPTSISYDQIQDIEAYAAEQRGVAKEKESISWLLRTVRSLRRRYGDIHVRFGEPLSLAKEFDIGEQPDPGHLGIQKLAFKLMVRINRVTPITPTSVVTIALLANEDRALSCDDIVREVGDLLAFVDGHDLPTTEPLNLDTPSGVLRILERLVEHGIVSYYDAGPEAVYMVRANQHLSAAYYRNTIIHFFVSGAIAELALLAASETEDRNPGQVFWDEVMRLRDLLKFEFFFSEKDAFREQIHQEMAYHDPAWEEQVKAGVDQIRSLLRHIKPLSSPWVLRPFLEAYQVVADALVARSPYVEVDRRRFIWSCLALGRQYRLQRRIATEESVSQVLFKSAFALAENRGLLDVDEEDLGGRRRSFAGEIHDVLRRIDAVEAIAAARRAGL